MRWHTADFDTLSWNQVHAHGWRIVERGLGEADLALDIDWILDRPDPGEGREGFVLAQAMLVFHDIAGLRFVLDYLVCSAASGPFVIERVHREPLLSSADALEDADAADRAWPEDATIAEDYGPWQWRVDLAWPEGGIAFEASGFSQWLVGEPQAMDGPVLPATLRS